MQLYGYIKQTQTRNEELLHLKELTLCSDPDELESLAAFLMNCAKGIRNSCDWDHEHFQSEDGPDIIVFNQKHVNQK